MRMLITGAAGMLGRDLCHVASESAWEITPLTHPELDIRDRDAVRKRLAAEQPDVVVNCAAWTDVDGAEEAPEDALAINGTGAGNVAGAAHASGAWTIHISSDYVFDGAKREPYVESDLPAPQSAYGRSKLAGEAEVAREAPGRHTIVRSSWLFGVHGHSFPSTILRLADERGELSVVDDQRGCPTFTEHLARGLVQLAQGRHAVGIAHLAGQGSCSWFELASYLVELAELDCQLRPVTTAEMPRPAVRPAYSVLGTERPDLPELPPWQRGVEDFMAVRV